MLDLYRYRHSCVRALTSRSWLLSQLRSLTSSRVRTFYVFLFWSPFIASAASRNFTTLRLIGACSLLPFSIVRSHARQVNNPCRVCQNQGRRTRVCKLVQARSWSCHAIIRGRICRRSPVGGATPFVLSSPFYHRCPYVTRATDLFQAAEFGRISTASFLFRCKGNAPFFFCRLLRYIYLCRRSSLFPE